MKVQAVTSVTALKTETTMLACFHHTCIKQKFGQEIDGKISVVGDGETNFYHCFKEPNTSN